MFTAAVVRTADLSFAIMGKAYFDGPRSCQDFSDVLVHVRHGEHVDHTCSFPGNLNYTRNYQKIVTPRISITF